MAREARAAAMLASTLPPDVHFELGVPHFILSVIR